MHTTGNIYIESGSPTEAIIWYERCYKNRQQLYGPEHTSTISVLSSQSHTYLTINDYTNAESSFINLCNLRKAVLGLGQYSNFTICNLYCIYMYNIRVYLLCIYNVYLYFMLCTLCYFCDILSVCSVHIYAVCIV